MSKSPVMVYGVWQHDWEDDTLIGLYWTREDAEAKAESGGMEPGAESRPRWFVEEHVIPGPPPGEDEDA